MPGLNRLSVAKDGLRLAIASMSASVNMSGMYSLLLQPDSVLAGQDSTDLDAQLEDLASNLEHGLGVSGLALVEQDGGVQIAVSGVQQVGDRVSGAAGDVFDPRQHLDQSGPGDGAIDEKIVRSQASEGTEYALTSGPQLLTSGWIGGGPDFERVVEAAHLFNRRDFLLDGLCESVHFDEQDRSPAPSG